MMRFKDRSDAGKLLGSKLLKYKKLNPLILALPRGGLPVASEIATLLDTPLNVLVVRKIGAPFNPEFAIGAVCEEEEAMFNEAIVAEVGLKDYEITGAINLELERIHRQILKFRNGKRLENLAKKVVVLVDDGLATGATMLAAIQHLKKKEVAKIIIAVPVAAADSAQAFRSKFLRPKIDELVSLQEPSNFMSVGNWYEDFSQVSDDEVLDYLKPYQHDQIAAKASRLTDAIENSYIELKRENDLTPLIESIKNSRVVMLGEASHGTKEFYQMRRIISERLIKDHGFNFIAVEGDWPDAYQLHQFIQTGKGKQAKDVLMNYHRWPTWMWANEEIVKLAEWMRNQPKKAGFFGLDVYSLFESMNSVVGYLEENKPQLAQEIEKKYACFEPFQKDEIAYARSLLAFPKGCEEEVISNLQNLLKIRVDETKNIDEKLFSAQQNARIAANAEGYYRSMLKGDASSWNVRDSHMMETLDLLLNRYGEDSKCIVWAHNTHIGDYRATDMVENGYVNLGGLARLSYGEENVALVGFGSDHGEVLAGSKWGGAEEIMPLPPAPPGTYEKYFHDFTLKHGINRFYFLFRGDPEREAFAQQLGHRAVGVVYHPRHEARGNYVPTKLSQRYDAFIFIDKTQALKSLHGKFQYGEFPETWPSGL